MRIKPATECEPDEIRESLGWAAEVATAEAEPVTVLGLGPNGAGVSCRARCQFSHPGSVVVIPDEVMIELWSNGWVEADTKKLTRPDGRTVWLHQVGNQPG